MRQKSVPNQREISTIERPAALAERKNESIEIGHHPRFNVFAIATVGRSIRWPETPLRNKINRVAVWFRESIFRLGSRGFWVACNRQ